MPVYYRFDHDQPKTGQVVHCYTTLEGFRKFVLMMKQQDPEFLRMKFWEINGQFVKPDEGDALVRVISAKEIKI